MCQPDSQLGTFGLRCQEVTDDTGLYCHQSQLSMEVDDKLAMKATAALGPSSTSSHMHPHDWLETCLVVVSALRLNIYVRCIHISEDASASASNTHLLSL
ncbi:hypothetical protein Tco_0134275 [Tanacetum coccineum]